MCDTLMLCITLMMATNKMRTFNKSSAALKKSYVTLIKSYVSLIKSFMDLNKSSRHENNSSVTPEKRCIAWVTSTFILKLVWVTGILSNQTARSRPEADKSPVWIRYAKGLKKTWSTTESGWKFTWCRFGADLMQLWSWHGGNILTRKGTDTRWYWIYSNHLYAKKRRLWMGFFFAQCA